MIRWLEKTAKVWIVFVFLFLFLDGLEKMYFHQDDILLLAGLAGNLKETLWQPASGHLIFLFNFLYLLEWKLFGLNFGGYLLVSLLLHGLVVWVVGKIIYDLSGKKIWSILGSLAVVINVNFYEVVWMSSSQMMSVSTLFSLLCLWVVLRFNKSKSIEIKKLFGLYLLALIPGLTWGTGLPIPFWLLLTFGWKMDHKKIRLSSIFWPLLAAQLSLLVIYLRLAIGKSSIYIHPEGYLRTLFEMIKFNVFAIAYSIIGRYFFPFANRLGRQVVFLISLAFGFKFLRDTKYWMTIHSNIRLWSFTLFVVIGSYVLISLPRWQFGLGQAAAPRYAYLPIMFLSVAIFTTLAKINYSYKLVARLMIVLLMLSGLSLGAFTQVTVKWTERPNKNRILFKYLQEFKADQCLKDDILPWYIVESDKWRLSYIWPIFNKDFLPFKPGENCISVDRDVTKTWQPIISQ